MPECGLSFSKFQVLRSLWAWVWVRGDSKINLWVTLSQPVWLCRYISHVIYYFTVLSLRPYSYCVDSYAATSCDVSSPYTSNVFLKHDAFHTRNLLLRRSFSIPMIYYCYYFCYHSFGSRTFGCDTLTKTQSSCPLNCPTWTPFWVVFLI